MIKRRFLGDLSPEELGKVLAANDKLRDELIDTAYSIANDDIGEYIDIINDGHTTIKYSISDCSYSYIDCIDSYGFAVNLQSLQRIYGLLPESADRTISYVLELFGRLGRVHWSDEKNSNRLESRIDELVHELTHQLLHAMLSEYEGIRDDESLLNLLQDELSVEQYDDIYIFDDSYIAFQDTVKCYARINQSPCRHGQSVVYCKGAKKGSINYEKSVCNHRSGGRAR